jgi:UDP-N-acetylglucosamine 2-epimerase (non-hydrolysing)
MNRLKVLTIVGTRPEIIRLSVLIPKLDKEVDHVLIHTGQNFDRQLNQVFFEELGLREPDHYLSVDTSSVGSVIADTIRKTESIIEDERPDAVVILGDTNSSLAAVIAERLHIPVYHLEAGNRSFDKNVPEELNRKLVDHISTFNLVYSEHARRNLLREGLDERNIFLTGSPMPEVLAGLEGAISSNSVLSELQLTPDSYLLVSLHRQENVDSETHLMAVLSRIKAVATSLDKKVLFSLHPRTAKKISGLEGLEDFIFHPPFGLIDFISLQKSAYCVVSDSGSISEEALILNFPAVTLRNSMERPEALESGGVILAPTESGDLLQAIQLARQPKPSASQRVYPNLEFSRLVLNVILSTASVSRIWSGLRS